MGSHIAPVSPEQFKRSLEQAGLPPPVVAMSVALGDAVRAGEFDLSFPVFEQLLGRPPISGMLADHGSLVWIGVMAAAASAVIAPLLLVPLSRRLRFAAGSVSS